ncbi:hypothetical protein LUX33_11125 [Actinomadura madurae]|uniref:hypothetical protein n=1 Tax=Actinomadura madurae TaxID=1993 RepID=UPI0020D20EFD|nr:hypothetical protein [Actinomadura madurae]MCP9948907.1 hypothetical protein [Actinomadura madurae]
MRDGLGGRSQSSSGTDRKTGPRGGVIATRYASASAAGTSSARSGCRLHLTYGRGNCAGSSAPRNGWCGSMARDCWPAITTTGTRSR